jgi:hypothetical protein
MQKEIKFKTVIFGRNFLVGFPCTVEAVTRPGKAIRWREKSSSSSCPQSVPVLFIFALKKQRNEDYENQLWLR